MSDTLHNLLSACPSGSAMKIRFLGHLLIFLAALLALCANPSAMTWIEVLRLEFYNVYDWGLQTLRGLANHPPAVLNDTQLSLSLWNAVANFMKIVGVFFIALLYARSSRQT
jgi:hypothetical protein